MLQSQSRIIHSVSVSCVCQLYLCYSFLLERFLQIICYIWLLSFVSMFLYSAFVVINVFSYFLPIFNTILFPFHDLQTSIFFYCFFIIRIDFLSYQFSGRFVFCCSSSALCYFVILLSFLLLVFCLSVLLCCFADFAIVLQFFLIFLCYVPLRDYSKFFSNHSVVTSSYSIYWGLFPILIGQKNSPKNVFLENKNYEFLILSTFFYSRV